MGKFNEAELHAIKQLDPPGFLRWLLPNLDPDLEWYTWLESQVSPPQGVPYLRCDCVAGLRSRSGTQAPWVCLVEAQAQPLARFAVWMLIYMGLVHEDLRHGPHGQDRFQMMGAILNLTDGDLSSSLDWLPPLQASTAEEQQLGEPGALASDNTQEGEGEPSPPKEQAHGVRCRFWKRDVRAEQADLTLAQIDQGELALCILVWVVFMVGGDQPDIIRRWKELVMRQPESYLRADYIALTLVFAELVGREVIWSAALKEFNVQDSRIAQQWEDRGIEKGIEKGRSKWTLVGKIQAFQKMLKQPPTPDQELGALSEPALAALVTQLEQQVLPNGA